MHRDPWFLYTQIMQQEKNNPIHSHASENQIPKNHLYKTGKRLIHRKP